MLLPKQIIALKKIVSRAAGRFGFSTVRIERHERGPRAMATDGRRAVIFQWDEPEADKYPPIEGLSAKPVRKFAANVPTHVLADAGRGVVKRATSPVLKHLLLDESDTSMVKIAASDNVTRAQAQAVDAAFPDCADVIPAPARDGKLYDPARHGVAAFSHTRIGVNSRQFAETLRVVSDLAADDPNNTVVMTVPVEPNRPIRLDARCPGRRAAAAIMPVNVQFDQYDDPVGPRQPAEVHPPAARPLPAPTSPPTASTAPTTPPASKQVRKPRGIRKPPSVGSAVAPSNGSPR
ncbi:MAG TPA: hypothetical protein VFC46_09080 [Humisphaera sp.]|nr:hypothetical protein [Humisphaera sp.]